VPTDLIVTGGTAGLIAVLLWIGNTLWQEHRKNDADVRSQRDEAIAGWKSQSEATKAVAASNDRVVGLLERSTSRRRDFDQ
jgi:hypothetical protein